jgi:hypothetical protein
MCCFPIIEEGDDGVLETSKETDDGDASEYENERNLSARWVVNGGFGLSRTLSIDLLGAMFSSVYDGIIRFETVPN